MNRGKITSHSISHDVEDRSVILGQYISTTHSTVRSTAKKFGVSKSTVHKDVAERLKYIDPQLYKEVKQILEINKAQRHIRGGMATKLKAAKTATSVGVDVILASGKNPCIIRAIFILYLSYKSCTY